MHDAGPYVWLSQYCIGAVVRYDQAREVLSDWKRFTSVRGVGMEDFESHGRFRLPSRLNEADPRSTPCCAVLTSLIDRSELIVRP